MTADSQYRTVPKRRWKQPGRYLCAACGKEHSFCWNCPCGFMICAVCMDENLWGMSCNGITWTCPDCGTICSFGND